MSDEAEFCPDCNGLHPPSQACQDVAAQMRRLERLRKREIEAMEKLAANQAGTVLSFPHEAFKLMPALTTLYGLTFTDAEIAKKACDLVDAVVAEVGKRWSTAPPGWVRPGQPPLQ